MDHTQPHTHNANSSLFHVLLSLMAPRTLDRLALLVGLVVSLYACSELRRPSSDFINKLPVVQVGDPKTSNEYILFVPAKTHVPFRLDVKGTLFEKDQFAVTNMVVQKDLYIYKSWASLDGHTWTEATDLLSSLISVTLDSDGGKVEVRLDDRK